MRRRRQVQCFQLQQDRKIIGAKWYVKGYEAEYGKMNTTDINEYMSARDAVGHGTHTASTAAGALVADASFRGLASGVARGGAPRARLAVYKVCWATGDCTSADILAAFDDAIHDGVDVLSVSLGQAPPLPAYVDDVLSIGSLHAVMKGIVVVCSAGNSGPYSETVINSAPWVLTVAAGTIDRTFLAKITLGNNISYVGQTMYSGKHAATTMRIVYAEDVSSDNADDSDARISECYPSKRKCGALLPNERTASSPSSSRDHKKSSWNWSHLRTVLNQGYSICI